MSGSKRRECWTLNPRGKFWTEDENKFGQKLMEKMGWSKGQGLGKDKGGNPDIIAVSYKNDNAGLGFKEDSSNNWVSHGIDYNGILAELQETTSSNASQNNIESLEKKSKSAKGHVHYHRSVKGKDLSNYSSKDMKSIFGSRKKQQVEETDVSEVQEETFEVKSKESLYDYFRKKMKRSKNKDSVENGTLNENNDETHTQHQLEETNGKDFSGEDDLPRRKSKKHSSKKTESETSQETFAENLLEPKVEKVKKIKKRKTDLEENCLEDDVRKKKKQKCMLMDENLSRDEKNVENGVLENSSKDCDLLVNFEDSARKKDKKKTYFDPLVGKMVTKKKKSKHDSEEKNEDSYKMENDVKMEPSLETDLSEKCPEVSLRKKKKHKCELTSEDLLQDECLRGKNVENGVPEIGSKDVVDECSTSINIEDRETIKKAKKKSYFDPLVGKRIIKEKKLKLEVIQTEEKNDFGVDKEDSYGEKQKKVTDKEQNKLENDVKTKLNCSPSLEKEFKSESVSEPKPSTFSSAQQALLRLASIPSKAPLAIKRNNNRINKKSKNVKKKFEAKQQSKINNLDVNDPNWLSSQLQYLGYSGHHTPKFHQKLMFCRFAIRKLNSNRILKSTNLFSLKGYGN